MKIKSIREADVKDKVVLLRVDFNVPIEKGEVKDDIRMRRALPTIEHLLKENAKIVIMSHLGRPKGKTVKELMLDPVAKQLGKLIGKSVKKLDQCVGDEVEKAIKKMNPGDVILLENTRFYKEEEECEEKLCKQLAALGDIYVNDSFGTAHRKHASTYGIAKHIPAYAGFLIEKEVEKLSQLMKNVKKPLTIIIGGAKIDTKIGLIQNFLPKADYFLVGGGLANTFLAGAGFDVAESLYEPEKVELAREIMMEVEALREKLILPVDVIVADEIGDNVRTLDIPVEDVMGNMKILDIGTKTIAKFAEIIGKSKTVVWNGPIGLYEYAPFRRGTAQIGDAITENKELDTIIGGGDTLDAIRMLGFEEEEFTHVSTGGGAMLAFLEGGTLPGIEIVLKK